MKEKQLKIGYFLHEGVTQKRTSQKRTSQICLSNSMSNNITKNITDLVMLSIYERLKDSGRLPQNHLYWRLIKRLKHESIIKKIGYGTWEINEEKVKNFEDFSHLYHGYPQAWVGMKPVMLFRHHANNPKSDTFSPKSESSKIRGHAFQIEFKIPNLPNWENRINYLRKQNIEVKTINGGVRILLNLHGKAYKVWILDKKIIIYSPKYESYYTKTALESHNYAISDHFAIMDKLEALFKVSLKLGHQYAFKVNKQHYGKINDDLAKHYARDGSRLEIRNNEGLWALIDNSPNEEGIKTPEFEAVKHHSDMDNVVIPFYNDLKEFLKEFGEPFLPTMMFKIVAGNTLNDRQQGLNNAIVTKALNTIRDILDKK